MAQADIHRSTPTLITSSIQVAEFFGVDVSDYIELMEKSNLQEQIDSYFENALNSSVRIQDLPYGFSWALDYMLFNDTAIVSLEDTSGARIAQYAVRAFSVDSDSTSSRKAKKIRRLVLVGKGLLSLYCDGELPFIDLSELEIRRY